MPWRLMVRERAVPPVVGSKFAIAEWGGSEATPEAHATAHPFGRSVRVGRVHDRRGAKGGRRRRTVACMATALHGCQPARCLQSRAAHHKRARLEKHTPRPAGWVR